MLKIAVAGVTGRMGKIIIDTILASKNAMLVGAAARPGHDAIGMYVNGLSSETQSKVRIVSEVSEAIKEADVLIDFTRPEHTLANAKLCAEQHIALVTGTTGLTQDQQYQLQEFAQQTPIVFASNMSVGVNVALKLLEMAATALQDDYDVEIVEAHHKYKADAPSGTALTMGETVAKALGRDLSECAIYGREGFTGEREHATIGFSTVRGGDVIGDHTVMFLGEGDRIEVTHKASSRATFGKGALRAALWVSNKPPKLYDMKDVLGL